MANRSGRPSSPPVLVPNKSNERRSTPPSTPSTTLPLTDKEQARLNARFLRYQPALLNLQRQQKILRQAQEEEFRQKERLAGAIEDVVEDHGFKEQDSQFSWNGQQVEIVITTRKEKTTS